MKKIFILFSLFLINFSSVNAASIGQNFCPVEKDTGNAFTKTLSNITGANFIATKVIEIVMQKEIKKSLGSSVNVEIYPYTFGALTQGKIRKMTIDAKKLNLSGLIISNFKAETMCNYIHVETSGDDIFFKENAGLKFSLKITNDDLNATTKTSQFLKQLNSAKISFMGQTLFRVNSVKMEIKNNKLVISANIISPLIWGVEPKTVIATTGIKLVDGKISYTDFAVQNINLGNNSHAIASLFNILNPFTLEIDVTKNSHGYTQIKNVIIENNEIKIDGMIYIPKNK